MYLKLLTEAAIMLSINPFAAPFPKYWLWGGEVGKTHVVQKGYQKEQGSFKMFLESHPPLVQILFLASRISQRPELNFCNPISNRIRHKLSENELPIELFILLENLLFFWPQNGKRQPIFFGKSQQKLKKPLISVRYYCRWVLLLGIGEHELENRVYKSKWMS